VLRFTDVFEIDSFATDVVFEDGIALIAAEMIIPKMIVPIKTRNCLYLFETLLLDEYL